MDTAVAEPSTPVATTTETTSAAPAISAPSTSATTSERPKSFAEALERTATVQEPKSPAQPEAATTAQADATVPNSINPKAEVKAPPQDKWPQILENARVKARDEVERELGWARGVPKETMQEWAGIAQRMSQDPIAFLSEFTSELHSHPTYGPQLRSHAARTLATGRGQAQVDLSPDLIVDDGNGREIQTFSADRVQAIVQHAVQQAIAKEVQPLKSESEQRRAQAQKAEATKALHAKADDAIASVTDILEITDKMPATDRDRLLAATNELVEKDPNWRTDPVRAMEKAARLVWRTHVLPTIEARGEAKALDKLKQKAAGNTASGTGAGATPKRPTNAKELAAYMRAREGGAR
jgi:hypothetical protein